MWVPWYFTVLFLLKASSARLLPGVGPKNYKEGDDITMLVNRIHQGYGPSYDYYDERLHLCRPTKIEREPESLGEVLLGDRLYNSPIQLKMLKEESCVAMCKADIPREDTSMIRHLGYSRATYNWLIDGLPVGYTDDDDDDDEYGYREMKGSYNVNFPVMKTAYIDNPYMPYSIKMHVFNLANHFDITIEYYDSGNGNYRVVGATVSLKSFKRDDFSCKAEEGYEFENDANSIVTYTYSVKYEKSTIPWNLRWERYLHGYGGDAQIASIVNFGLIVLVLSSILLHWLYRGLKYDFARYAEINLGDSFEEDQGWKLLHGEVFRAPVRPMLLSIMVGSGAQLSLLVTVIVMLAVLGFISPDSRGALGTAMFVLYALFGAFGSYVSMATYKFCGGSRWQMNMILAPLLVPGFLFAIMLFLNIFLIYMRSSDAIPAATLFTMLSLWTLSLPLSFIGSVVAHRTNKWDEHPAKTKQIARQIPMQPWFLRMWPATFISGVLPFGAIAIELYLILASTWSGRVFHMFGFLLATYILLILITALDTLLLTYYGLCSENWKWQWRSFIIGGVGVSVYVFIHSMILTQFRLGGLAVAVLYIGYSFAFSFVMCLVTGSIGYLCSLFLVTKIYSSIKVD